MNNKQDKGFTLVELLIVIFILGILATVTVFAVRGITDRGQQNACAVDKRTLDTSIEAFYAQNQRDPFGQDELLFGPRPANAQTVAISSGTGGVLKSAPTATNWTFGYTGTIPTGTAAYTKPTGSKC